MKKMITYILGAVIALGSISAVSASPASGSNAVTEQTRHHKRHVKKHWKKHKVKSHKKHWNKKHHN